MSEPVNSSAEMVERLVYLLTHGDRRHEAVALLRGVQAAVTLKTLAAERDRLQAECSRLRQEAAWRPIDTAPRDKTYILLGHHGENNDFAPWAALGFYRTPDPWGPPDPWRRKWWILERDGFHPQNSRFEPTHWLPLPQPPAKEARE